MGTAQIASLCALLCAHDFANTPDWSRNEATTLSNAWKFRRLFLLRFACMEKSKRAAHQLLDSIRQSLGLARYSRMLTPYQ